MQLIVFSGLPGTGKSSLAEIAARRLSIPVFAKDWLESAIVRSGMTECEDARQQLGWAGYELLTTLAERQLRQGQSAILDWVASTTSIRNCWRALAQAYGAQWRVVECVCSDEELHRSRLSARKRGILNWRELTWTEVERVRGYYAPWADDRLVVDAASTMGENIEAVLMFLSRREPAFAL
jgi:predicted kinase